MNLTDLTLVICIVLSGLWSGLLLAVTNLLHPVFRGLAPADFARALGRFLPAARRAPANWVVVIGLAVMHWPVASQVREVVVIVCVPAVAHPPPDCMQVPVIELVPQSRPVGL